MDFEWIVINDGSTDATEETVRTWMEMSLFPIRYYRQERGGKYRAYNVALIMAKGDYFVTLDSDDYFLPYSIEQFYEVIPAIEMEKNCCGCIALKQYEDGRIVGTELPQQPPYITLYALNNIGYGGERTLLYKTNILRRFPFPEVENEIFVTEAVVYDQLDTYYTCFLYNRPLQVYERQKDGMTANFFWYMRNSPTGFKVFYRKRIDLATSFRERVGYVLRYHAFRCLSKSKHYNYNGQHSALVNLLSPCGILLKCYYRIRMGYAIHVSGTLAYV
jgi:glycosyltransferase involved in cell wall biosynthesis